MTSRNDAIFLGLIFAVISVALIAAIATLIETRSALMLAGYGCEGTTSTIYAKHEDALPRCDRIETVNIYAEFN